VSSLYPTFATETSRWFELRKEFENVRSLSQRAATASAVCHPLSGSNKQGPWRIDGCPNEEVKARLELALARGGNYLNRANRNPGDWWLDRLFWKLSSIRSVLVRKVTVGDEEVRVIQQVCSASEIYCSILERAELEGTSDSAALHDIVSTVVQDAMQEPEAKAIPEKREPELNVDPEPEQKIPPPIDDLGDQIDRLRQECDDMTIEDLAEGAELDPTTVSRHLRKELQPTRRSLGKYNRFFTKYLKKEVVLRRTQPRRS
jgi:DNA-binding transcriptional ArsR family regulator